MSMPEEELLVAFHEEVLSRGAEAALPSNLTDAWLTRLLHLAGHGLSPAPCIMAILAILSAKSRPITVVGKAELAVYLGRYRHELAREKASRHGNDCAARPTLDTILTSRAGFSGCVLSAS